MSEDQAKFENMSMMVPSTMSPSIFRSVERFEFAKKVASMLAASSMVPEHFRGPNGVGNCMIALNLAERLGIDEVGLMQTSYVVHGRPGFESKLLIALFNSQSKLFIPPLRWEMKGDFPKGKDAACRAYAKDKETGGDPLYGEWIDWEMVKAMGWFDKPGPDKKADSNFWHTMPGQMFRYRAAAFFINVYEPGLKLGIMTVDELEDSVIDITPQATVSNIKEIKIEGESGLDHAPGQDPYEVKEPKNETPKKVEDIRLQDVYRNEWVNLKEAGFSTYVHKNFAKIEANGTTWPELHEDLKAKWARLYPKNPWPLVDRAEKNKPKMEETPKEEIELPLAPPPWELQDKQEDPKSTFLKEATKYYDLLFDSGEWGRVLKGFTVNDASEVPESRRSSFLSTCKIRLDKLNDEKK